MKLFSVLRFCSLFLFSVLCFLFSSLPSLASQTYLRIHIESEPTALDPAQATGHREHLILQTLFEGLTRYDPKTLEPLPGVAERWTLSPDGKTYRFFLRKNAKWSDGKPVTAQDFWNGWEHLLNPKTNSPYAFQLFYLKGGKEYSEGKLKNPKEIGMKVIDPALFEVLLEKPIAYFLSLTAFPTLVPRRKDVPMAELVCNGAFVLESRNPKEGILLLPNKHYWGQDQVKLPGVLFRPFGDFVAALKHYDRTGIDVMADLPPNQVSLLKFRSDFRSAPILRAEYLTLATQKPPFDNRDVRSSLAYAIDRKTITDIILRRGDLAYSYLVPPGMPGYTNPGNPQTFDPWKAKHLLTKAGYNGQKKFPVIVLHYNNATDRLLVVKAVQEMWQKNLGIKVELLEEEWDPYLKRRRAHDFQVSWGGWTGDYVDPNTFLELFVSDNRQNNAAWSNAAYDALILEAQNTTDKAKRAKLFQEAETILLREVPIIPVLAKAKNYLIHPYIKGYYPNLLDIHPLRDVYSLRP